MHQSDNGVPVLSAVEKAGMADFLAEYEAWYEDIEVELMKSVSRIPDLAMAVSRMPEAQRKAEGVRTRELMKRAILEANWVPLLENQRQQGGAYAAMGVSFSAWFELVGDFQRLLGPHLVKRFLATPERLNSALLGMNRYIDIAMSVIAEEYLRTKERRIAQQQAAIQELSTPVLKLQDRMLLLPLIGVVDTQRARMITAHLLKEIGVTRAKVVVIDITGVPAVDSKVANHLLQTVAAARLMGATAVVTGLSAEVAQALVMLGVDLGALTTVGDLQGGVEEAHRLLGYRVVTLRASAEA